MIMYSDNEAAVLTANQEHINKMGRSRFMNRKIFYLHDEMVKGNIKPTWIATEEMDADIGTKHLKGSLYDYLSNRSFSRCYYDDEFDIEEGFQISSEEHLGVYDAKDTSVQGGKKVLGLENNINLSKFTPKKPINKPVTTISTAQKPVTNNNISKSKSEYVKIGGGAW